VPPDSRQRGTIAMRGDRRATLRPQERPETQCDRPPTQARAVSDLPPRAGGRTAGGSEAEKLAALLVGERVDAAVCPLLDLTDTLPELDAVFARHHLPVHFQTHDRLRRQAADQHAPAPPGERFAGI